MGDLFDYLFMYLLTMFLISLKITQFIDWSWWVCFAPTIAAFILHLMVLLIGEK